MGDAGHHGFVVKRLSVLSKPDDFFDVYFIVEDDKEEIIFVCSRREEVISFLETMIKKTKTIIKELKK